MKDSTIIVYYTLERDDDEDSIRTFQEYVDMIVSLTEGFTPYHAVVDTQQPLHEEDET